VKGINRCNRARDKGRQQYYESRYQTHESRFSVGEPLGHVVLFLAGFFSSLSRS
jgi:hypothetical protein